MAISYGSTTSSAATNKIHYIKIPKYDATYDYHISVAVNQLGNVGSNNGRTLVNHVSPELSSAGWTRKGGINGALFYTTGNPQYSIGIEVVNWSAWSSGASQDSSDGTGTISVWGPNNVDLSMDQYGDSNGEMYGVTSAGCFIRGGADFAGKANAVVSSLSGRSFVAHTANYIYLIATAGDTGSAGVQGYSNMRTVVRKVATAAGDGTILEAAVLDGGGSVGLEYNGTSYITSSRSLKTAILVYEKVKSSTPPPDPDPDPIDPGTLPTVPPSKVPHLIPYLKVGGVLKAVPDVKVKIGGTIKDVSKIQTKIGGVLKTTYQRDIVSTNFPQAFGTNYTWSTTTPTTSSSSMVATNNPYIKTFTASSFGVAPPSVAFNGSTNFSDSTGSNGFNNLPCVWTLEFNAYISFQSLTIDGWGMNHDYLNSPRATQIQGSNDGSAWTTLFDGDMPHAWNGDSWNWSKYESYPNQTVDGADPAIGFGPLGTKTLTSLSYKTSFFKYLRIYWYSNWANNSTAGDTRKYWNEPIETYDYRKSSAIQLHQLSFNVIIRPL